MQNKKPYEILYQFYSYLMKDIDYNFWANYLNDLIKDENLIPNQILEIAAGNGTLANILSQLIDKKIYLCDLSKTMLRDLSTNFPKTVCDMRLLPFSAKFDLIYSTFDSVNYLTSKKYLLQFFKEINRVLSDNGVFLFDVSLEKNSITNVEFFNRIENLGDIQFQQKSKYLPKKRLHINEFFIFSEGREFYEKHVQKIYPLIEYFNLLEKVNLYAVACYEAFTFENATEDSERAQFIVRKLK